MNATYSPEDNKLRLYAGGRLDPETYARVKAAGFIWAPKQELFVTPMWTPKREDLLIDLCGEIGDEDTSLVDRAEERAERFEDYSANRAEDAEQARAAVSAIADNIPMGQPILVGHHSEKHARKDAEKIENGMIKAVKMWETSKYWESRAAGAIHHAKYKELPAVRARRIKGLEADLRKQEKDKKQAETMLKLWANDCAMIKKKDGTETTFLSRAKWICNHYDNIYLPFPISEYPRPEGASTYEGSTSLWSALGGSDEIPFITPGQARDIAEKAHRRMIAHCDRWISHLENRLRYERAMLQESGGTVTDRKGPEKGGACKCWASPQNGWSYIQKVNKVSVTILDNWGNGGGNFTRTIPFHDLKGIMTAAEVQEKRDTEQLIENRAGDPTGFFLRDAPLPESKSYQAPEPTKFDAMKDDLREGVKVVSASQLFPTPPEIAAKMVELAEIEPGNRILEPSAGTGNLLSPIIAENTCGYEMVQGCKKPNREGIEPKNCATCETGTLQALRAKCEIVAIEINLSLTDAMRCKFRQGIAFQCCDFLEQNGNFGKIDRIIMNPPFENGSDIKHIQHALTMLNPGGRLVALCANGSRQRAAFMCEAELWEDLPTGSFKEQGTGVNVALMVLTAPDRRKEERKQFEDGLF
jgi:hypothetical protein